MQECRMIPTHVLVKRIKKNAFKSHVLLFFSRDIPPTIRVIAMIAKQVIKKYL